jgi:hypothetical protein
VSPASPCHSAGTDSDHCVGGFREAYALHEFTWNRRPLAALPKGREIHDNVWMFRREIMTAAEPPPTVVQPGEGRVGYLGDGIGVVFKLWGEDTDGALSVVEHLSRSERWWRRTSTQRRTSTRSSWRVR